METGEFPVLLHLMVGSRNFPSVFNEFKQEFLYDKLPRGVLQIILDIRYS